MVEAGRFDPLRDIDHIVNRSGVLVGT